MNFAFSPEFFHRQNIFLRSTSPKLIRQYFHLHYRRVFVIYPVYFSFYFNDVIEIRIFLQFFNKTDKCFWLVFVSLAKRVAKPSELNLFSFTSHFEMFVLDLEKKFEGFFKVFHIILNVKLCDIISGLELSWFRRLKNFVYFFFKF